MSLAAWSDHLLAEIFGDASGDARPLTSILVDDELLRRALARMGVEADAPTALRLFIEAFPTRSDMVRWFGGASEPGDALVAFLTLCCYAAGEVADIDSNDYRGRLAEILGWSERVADCAALPRLWRRVEKLVASKKGVRPFKLPNPGVYRSQIGHAIELAFPSRLDGSKLHTSLSGRTFDTEDPRAVLNFVEPLVHDGRLSASFRTAFDAFKTAFHRGDRALVDEKFWVGWKLIATHWRPVDRVVGFDVVSDDWGGYRILGADERPLDLCQAARLGIIDPGAARLIEDGAPIYLELLGWGRWTWAGPGAAGARTARAALIRKKTYSPSRLSAFDLSNVSGAEGWAFTLSIDLLLRADQRAANCHDGLLDATICGTPRIDGGLLARPTLPVELRTTAPMGAVEVVGNEADRVRVDRVSPDIARLWFQVPITANLSVKINDRSGNSAVSRALRARGRVTAPTFTGCPDRMMDDEPPNPVGWSSLTTTDPQYPVPLADTRVEEDNGVIADVIEFLAARTGPIPLGEFLETLGVATEATGSDPWEVVRALLEAGAIDPLRNRAWRGRAVLSRPPTAVLRETTEGWIMALAGLPHEVAISRFVGRADGMGLQWERRSGFGEWALPTFLARSSGLEDLRQMASDLDLPTGFWNPSLTGLTPLSAATPNADGTNHSQRRCVAIRGGQALTAAQVELWLCQGENDDRAPVWMVTAPGRSARYWRLRHEAILDACAAANVPALTAENNHLHCAVPGAYLPLPAARWLRFLSCTSSGPTGLGHAYDGSSASLRQLGSFLGPLLAMPRSVISRAPAQPAVIVRASRRHRSIASRAGADVTTTPIWRWARHQPRDNG